MAQIKPVPEGMRTVTPHLTCAGAADAIEFYKRAFGAVELTRLPGPGGKLLHAMIRIGDSNVMLVDEFPDHGSFGPKAIKARRSPSTSTSTTLTRSSGAPSMRGRRSRCRLRTCSGVTAMADWRTRSATNGRWPRTCAT